MRYGPRIKLIFSFLLFGTAAIIVVRNLDDFRQMFFPPREPMGDGMYWGPMWNPELREFTYAVREGNIQLVKDWLARDPNMAKLRSRRGSALHSAAMVNNPEMVQLLLDHGADPNLPGRRGGTPLHWAAWMGAKESAELLIKAGADVNALCVDYQCTPMLWAAAGSTGSADPEGDYLGICRVLQEAGARCDVADAEGTPAVRMATPEVAAFLMRHGATDDPAAYTRRPDIPAFYNPNEPF